MRRSEILSPLVILIVVVEMSGGCEAGAPSSDLSARLQAASSFAGVPQEGFPSWAERTVWVLANRDRADPEAALSTCDAGCDEAACYRPAAPLAYDLSLNHSARLQATLLSTSDSVLMHPSPCVLNPDIASTYPQTCDGSSACACATPLLCTGPSCACAEDTSDATKFTQPFTRIELFAPGLIGYAENVAAGYPDPPAVEVGWLQEPCSCCSASQCPTGLVFCSTDGSEGGHRYNILTAVGSLGVGAAPIAAGNCYSSFCTGTGCPPPPQESFFVQDFGTPQTPPPLPKLVGGSHFPSDAGAVTFFANWYDPDGGAPQSGLVLVGGVKTAMALDRGDGGNATWAARLEVGSCQPYSFSFQDSNGATLVFPSSGTFFAGTGCTADYAASSSGNPDGGAAAHASGCSTSGEAALGIALLGLVLVRERRACRSGSRFARGLRQ